MARSAKSRHITITRSLARPGDPLILADGSVIEEDNDDLTEVQISNEPSRLHPTVEPKDYRPTARRAIKEFPAKASMFNAISVVLAHTLYGISNVEICDALQLSMEQLDGIREHRGYSELFTTIMNEFINANSEMLQSRIAAYSHDAISTIGGLVTKAKKEETRLSASKDVLDRAGARPQDLANQQAAQMDGLRINIIRTGGEEKIEVDINIGAN